MLINPSQTITLERIGNEKTPILIIDDFLLDCDPLIGIAQRNNNFSLGDSSIYPGVRALLPKEYVIALLHAVAKLLYETYQIPKHMRIAPLGMHYSLVSLPPDSLNIVQQVPHFDTSRMFYFALLHYLNPLPHGGTGFFRHKVTGYERISDTRESEYLKILETQFNQHKITLDGYFVESREEFELYHQIDYKPNRIVLYPGNLLHSGLIDGATDISDNPETGRLTANTFFEFR